MERKKVLLAIPLGVLMLGLIIAGAVYYHTIDVTATVSEALSSLTIALDFSGFPGETITKTFDIQNDASVNLDTTLTWTELTNVNGVVYTTDMTKTVTLLPGANSVGVEFVYATDTVIGDVTGEITLERVA